jgi:hypothetical protein
VKYLKTIINKHRNGTSATNHNGAASTLAIAAVSATALAEAAAKASGPVDIGMPSVAAKKADHFKTGFSDRG